MLSAGQSGSFVMFLSNVLNDKIIWLIVFSLKSSVLYSNKPCRSYSNSCMKQTILPNLHSWHESYKSSAESSDAMRLPF